MSLRRAAGLGLKGAELRAGLASIPIFYKEWDILWEASVECNMPHLLPPPRKPAQG